MLRFNRLILLIAGLGIPLPLQAQFPQPRIQSVFPAGGSAGGEVEVQVTGTDLEGASGLWFDHPGLRGFLVKGTTFQVTIAPGVPPGNHDVRLVSALGISNPRTFVVGSRPELLEAEPNDQPDQANPLPLESTMNGRLDKPADRDCFAFEAGKDQRLLVDLATSEIESRLDARLQLRDPTGRTIAESPHEDSVAPFLDVSLPSTGRYVLVVQDLIYAGSPEHGYRLTITQGPRVDAIVPNLASPGRETRLTLYGRNLGGEPIPDRTIQGRPLEKREIPLLVPELDEPDPAAPAQQFLGSFIATRRGFEGQWTASNGLRSNPFFVALTDDPIILEKEPNSPDTPQAVSLPCDISGAFDHPDDVDVYRFEAKKGQVWWIEASAERMGSPADPVLTVQRVTENQSVQDQANAEDMPEPTGGLAASLATVDAVLRFPVPADGMYQVVVSDLYRSQRGDVRFSYRLQIRPARPDFRLFVLPGSVGAAPQGWNLRAGGRVSGIALIARLDGLDLPVRVEARNLPPGVTMTPVVIGPGQYQAPIVLTAEADAPRTIVTPYFVGRTLNPDRKEILSYRPGTPLLPEVEHRAISIGPVRPPEGTPLGLARATRGLPLAILDGSPFRLTVQPESIVVNPGDSVELTVEVKRAEPFTEAVQLSATMLPTGTQGANATIAKDATTGQFKLTTTKNAPPGTYTLLLVGTGPVPFAKDPNAKTKPNVNVTEPANPVLLRITRPN